MEQNRQTAEEKADPATGRQHRLAVVLVEPEIPPNTGNIARTCAATGVALHLVKPLGFSIDDASLKRAGLDYWPYVELEVHENLTAFMGKYGKRPLYLATTKGKRSYTELRYEPDSMLLFGQETTGLPRQLIEDYRDRTIRIPMGQNTKLRSLNLSNSAAIVIYEALRQLGFPGLS
ncbi:MAG TPA: tRNA (uridine(34)/cytosine(34)/5-carboxymethylaminomethyluridine(34)-2'-O)-methyltransferase TrmL [Clostridiales bacterium]|jgi:tRNA (cytidine/uridine-2'-O-)-methyltransferase|nr:tRNA (uridine(34)/cytosine(34)/5-carboxymethylaminomethyluridine(34)-2'-O)-methyltransferase TrmL [Clostridiales bacterium]